MLSTEGAVGHCPRQRVCGLTALFLLPWVRGEKGPHALQQRTGKTKELTIKLCTAQSSAPLTTRSNPYGIYKCTRSAQLEQSVLLRPTRRPSTVSILWERSEGAFFIRPWSC